MRLAVVSDVHGNVAALRHVIGHLATQAVDGVINLGDCVTAPLWPKETWETLKELGAHTVRGNHDRWLGDEGRVAQSPVIAFAHGQLSSEDRASLTSLPPTVRIDGDVVAVHGTPASDTEYLLEDSIDDRLCLSTSETVNDRLRTVCGARLVLCGHSHQQNAVWASGRRLVVNPGSVGCPRYAGNPAPWRNEAGSPHARYAVVTRRNGDWSVELFVLAYDWTPVVERALAVGHPDWAEAFAKNG